MSVVAPKGFVANGISAGIKSSGARDLTVVATEDRRAVPTAAVFTTNRAAAAPVQVSRRHLEASAGIMAGVLLSSGNANAATGASGEATTLQACGLLASALGVPQEQLLVCATGLIGIPLPLEPFIDGVPRAVAGLGTSEEHGRAAAEALMTTDTFAKVEIRHGAGYTIGAIGKGAAMIAPNMATMLAVLTTDVVIEPAELQRVLAHAVDHTFNRLTIDGCTSTNDTVIAMASGASGVHADDEFALLVQEVCQSIADKIAQDAEGGSKVVKVTVTGALSEAEALAGARKIAESQLVKCSFLGEDPYWGRVASELGSSGIDFDMERLEVAYQGVVVARGGVQAPFDLALVTTRMAEPHIELRADLGLGAGEATVTTVDLGYGYIDENKGTS
jgi:glutamate N-acetyltransferase/amino-acid N-acetyltransferase